MFYLTGIVVTFFLAALLVSKRGKTGADRILGLWLVIIGLHLTSFYLLITGKNLSFPFLLGIEIPFPLLHGPLLYLYTGSVTNLIPSRKDRILHFAPFLITYALLLSFMLSPEEHKIFVYQHNGVGYEMEKRMVTLATIVSGVVYVVLSLRLLARHKQSIRNQFSFAEKINLAWLRYLIYGIGGIWILVILGKDPVIYSAVVVFVILLGYFGINQVGIFTQRRPLESHPIPLAISDSEIPGPSPALHNPPETPEDSEMPSAVEPAKPKYLKSSLDEATAGAIHGALTRLMDEQRPYTNPSLTLDELAMALNVHKNNLSQVINTYEKKNFYDYINSRRVEEFKRIAALPESRKFTLLGLANNCGFNSKSSFNRNFKNSTGLSPTEYLKQSNIQLEP